MKKQDEEFFAAKMHELADKFNLINQKPVAGCCPPGQACVEVDPKAADEFNDMSQAIYADFRKAGYNDDDWNALMQSSGAGKRLRLGA